MRLAYFRNVIILSISVALGFSGAPLVLFVGGFVGAKLAPSSSLATLPISVMVIGIALFTIPAAFLMKKLAEGLALLFPLQWLRLLL